MFGDGQVYGNGVLIPSNSGLITSGCPAMPRCPAMVLIPSNSGLITSANHGFVNDDGSLNPLEFGADH